MATDHPELLEDVDPERSAIIDKIVERLLPMVIPQHENAVIMSRDNIKLVIRGAALNGFNEGVGYAS